MDKISELRSFVEEFGTAPTLEEMERRGLKEKGLDGPTGAHVIEEIHTPFNFAYITATTGTMAFQNLVGVTHNEIPGRVEAAKAIFSQAGIEKGCRMLISYPPIVSVFSKAALDDLEVKTEFLVRSERAAFILAMCEKQPEVVAGESSFMKKAIEDARGMGVLEKFPRGCVFLAAGTPLDMELLEVVKSVDGHVHDLYGCQEFGFLTLDGVPLRKDLTLIPHEGEYQDLFVGGLSTGDCFAVSDKGHMCNPEGKILTYSRKRHNTECEIILKKTTANGLSTARRLARTILRLKAKFISLDKNLEFGAEATQLLIRNQKGEEWLVEGPMKTQLFDELMQAQIDYQSRGKADPVWLKQR